MRSKSTIRLNSKKEQEGVKKKKEIMNQDNSFEEFCYKGLRKNVADAGRSIVKGGLFVCLFV